jgi:hypothetical protein
VQLACRKDRVSERTFYNWKPKFLAGWVTSQEYVAKALYGLAQVALAQGNIG